MVFFPFHISNFQLTLSRLALNKIIFSQDGKKKTVSMEVIDSLGIIQVKNKLYIKLATKNHKDSFLVVIDICCGDLNNKTTLQLKGSDVDVGGMPCLPLFVH